MTPYESLLRRGSTGEVRPALAEAWLAVLYW